MKKQRPPMIEEIPPPMKKRRVNYDVDYISNLSNDVLAHILSFVSTKEAVKTSVLSKRWRHVWGSVPVLNLDVAEFVPEEICDDEEKNEIYQEKFSNFVRGVLRNRENLLLDVFKLEWSTRGRSKYCTPDLVEECVSHAVLAKPRVFSLHIFDRYKLNLNYNQIFTCASLEELSIMTVNEGEYAAYEELQLRIINLPRLKTLKIAYKQIDDSCLDSLFLGCSALEELELSECGLLISQIDSTTLRKLVIQGCLNGTELEICAPSLVHLSLQSEWMMGSFSGNFPSLVDACIYFPRPYDPDFDYYYDDDDDDDADADDGDDKFAIILNSLSNATSLNLTFEHLSITDFLNTQKEEGMKFPVFKNLRSLVLEKVDCDDIGLVALFLQHSPSLQPTSASIKQIRR